MVDRSIFVLQKPGLEKVMRYESAGVRYADVPPGTRVLSTLVGWDFLLPDGSRKAVGGHPMELRPDRKK